MAERLRHWTAGLRTPWRRLLAIAAGVLLLLAIALRIALPYAVERAVPVGAERFGFDASVANVDFALLRGHVAVEGLRVAPRAAGAQGERAVDLLRLRRFFVNAEWSRLFAGELRLAELVLEAPELRLERAPDGYIELPALPPSTEPKQEPAAEAEPEEPSEPFPVHVESLSIRETAFRLADAVGGAVLVDFALRELGFTDLRLEGAKVGLGGIRISEPVLRVRREVQQTKAGARGAAPAPAAEPAGPPPELRIEDLEIERAEFEVLTEGEPVRVALRLKTTGVTLAPESPFPLDLGLEAGEGRLTLAGQLGLNPLSWDGKIGWQGLAVPMFVRAALPELVPWVRSCSASGELDVKLRMAASAGAAAGLRASGRLGVDDFAVEDPEQQLAFGWKSLAIDLSEASVPLDGGAEPLELTLAKVALVEPTARYVLPNTALERLFPSAPAEGAPAEPAPAAASEAAEPRIRVDAIEVRGGGAEFEDRSLRPPYRGRLRDLSVDVAGVRLPERSFERLRVRGIAPERAPFELRGALPGASGNLSFKLERLPLAQFTPYAASAADLRIPKGDLSLDSKAKLARSGAAGKVDTQVVVHGLAIQGGPNAISVAGMPLDLALALLRDPKGDIRLPIPLAFGERGASVGIGEIVVGALRAAITGAVTSPIKALGVLLPSGGAAQISFDPVAFAAGIAEPAPEATERLAPLAALLRERPGLGLALVGHAGPEDRPALGEQILIERAAADRGLPEVEGLGFFARRRIHGALAERGRGEPGALEAEDAALLAKAVDATEVPAERFAGLARRRAEALRDALAAAHAIAPARLVVEAAAEPARPEVALELRVNPVPESEPAA
jgi:hypothetical protein